MKEKIFTLCGRLGKVDEEVILLYVQNGFLVYSRFEPRIFYPTKDEAMKRIHELVDEYYS